MPMDPTVTDRSHHLDMGLNSIRAIRAVNRATAIAAIVKPIHLVPQLSEADRRAIAQNLLDRFQIFAAITHAKAGQMPAGWEEDYADRTLQMVLALAQVTR